MRFLYIMLSTVWLSFIWVCYLAIQPQDPIQPPWHVIGSLQFDIFLSQQLNRDPHRLIDDRIMRYQYDLTQLQIHLESIHQEYREKFKFRYNPTRGSLEDTLRAFIHFQIATEYWKKAYLQETKTKQMAFLRLSLNEVKQCLNLVPDSPHYVYCAADLYHQLREYKNAEPYYLQSLRMDPTDQLALRRYYEFIEESGFEKRFDPNAISG